MPSCPVGTEYSLLWTHCRAFQPLIPLIGAGCQQSHTDPVMQLHRVSWAQGCPAPRLCTGHLQLGHAQLDTSALRAMALQ